MVWSSIWIFTIFPSDANKSTCLFYSAASIKCNNCTRFAYRSPTTNKKKYVSFLRPGRQTGNCLLPFHRNSWLNLTAAFPSFFYYVHKWLFTLMAAFVINMNLSSLRTPTLTWNWIIIRFSEHSLKGPVKGDMWMWKVSLWNYVKGRE